MDGFDLYKDIKKLDPSIKVCFITGFEVNYRALQEIFPKLAQECYISKPTTIRISTAGCMIFRGFLADHRRITISRRITIYLQHLVGWAWAQWHSLSKVLVRSTLCSTTHHSPIVIMYMN
jgi:hypothetical protein